MCDILKAYIVLRFNRIGVILVTVASKTSIYASQLMGFFFFSFVGYNPLEELTVLVYKECAFTCYGIEVLMPRDNDYMQAIY